jgi:hypothetical protein
LVLQLGFKYNVSKNSFPTPRVSISPPGFPFLPLKKTSVNANRSFKRLKNTCFSILEKFGKWKPNFLGVKLDFQGVKKRHGGWGKNSSNVSRIVFEIQNIQCSGLGVYVWWTGPYRLKAQPWFRHLRGENLLLFGVTNAISISLFMKRFSIFSFSTIRILYQGQFCQLGGRESKREGPK